MSIGKYNYIDHGENLNVGRIVGFPFNFADKKKRFVDVLSYIVPRIPIKMLRIHQGT